MQDFRPRLTKPRIGSAQVEQLLAQGQLVKAIRKAKALAVAIPQERIDQVAQRMLRQHRASELLTLIDQADLRLQYDAVTLLRAALAARDYHGFLKQAHRLKIKVGLEPEIDQAIAAVRLRAPNEAEAWRRKFAEL